MTTVDETRTASAGTPDGSDGSAFLTELADALRRVGEGDFKVRLQRRTGLAGDVVDRLNSVIEIQSNRNRELLRIRRVVGREGRLFTIEESVVAVLAAERHAHAEATGPTAHTGRSPALHAVGT